MSGDSIIEARKKAASERKRGPHGEFLPKEVSGLVEVNQTESATAPIASFSINNPLPAFKAWLKKLLGNETITIKVPVLTAIAILLVIFSLGGVGGFLTGIKSALAKKVPIVNNIFPEPTREAAYVGIVRKSSDGKFYLQTGDGQAVNLIIPDNVNLEKFVGKRIFASGVYNIQSMYLTVTDATDLEVLPQQAVAIPTSVPEVGQ